jgi:hypothetical protein
MAKKEQIPPKRNPEIVRKEFADLLTNAEKIEKESNDVILKLATRAYEVQVHKYWRHYVSPKAKKAYRSFDQWLKEDAGAQRSRIYSELRVVRYLPISLKEIEAIGKTKCEEVAKVAKFSPQKLGKVLEAVKKNPQMNTKDVRQLVSNAIAGNATEPVRYSYFEFAMPSGEAKIVKQALKVMQATDPLEDPENPVSMGRHLYHMCTDWLLGAEQQEILKKLEEMGVEQMAPIVTE